MSNTRNTGFLTNVVKYTDKGDISFVSGSTTLMSISSSGAVTVTGVISGSNALTSSYSQNSELLDNLDSTSFVFTSSFNTYSSSMSTRVSNNESTGSTLTTASASFAVVSSSYSSASGSLSTRVTKIEGNYATTGSNIFLGAQTVCANITSTGTIIAQTLNVQQVTSSVVYSSGSNIFGCSLANTQQFTGSVTMTGSLTVTTAGTLPEFQVNSGGTIKGNALTDVHQVTGSLRITGSSNHFILGCNVGIGCNTPTNSRLLVAGTHASGNSILGVVPISNNTATIGLYNSSGTRTALFYSDTGFVTIETDADPLLLRTAGNNRLCIGGTGVASFTCQVCAQGFYASSVQSGITIDSTTNGDTIIASRGLSSALHGIVRTVGQNGVTCMQIISTRSTTDGNLPASVNALWGLTNHDMVIATNNTERMRINSVGNVQIGTISNSTGNILEAFQNNIRITAISNGNDTAGFFMRVMSGASQVGNTTLRVNNAGTFQLYTGTSSEAMNLQITSAGISCFASTVCAPTLVVQRNLGTLYNQTSTTGTTSIVDTGIFYNTAVVGFGTYSLYQLTLSGNPNAAGSSLYANTIIGYLTVVTGFDFGISSVIQQIAYSDVVNRTASNIGGLTVAACFWNGSAESSQQVSGTTTNQIRIKITGYNSSFIGTNQDLRLTKLL